MNLATRNDAGRCDSNRETLATLRAVTRRVQQLYASAARGGTAGGAVLGHLQYRGERANGHLEIGQHRNVLLGRATQCREVVADDERIDARGHTEILEFP